MPQDTARRWLRDPLLAFLLLGVAVFALDHWLNGRDARLDVDVTADEVEQHRARWTAQWGRAPTASELERLLEEAVDEEILYREAQRLGLGRDDAIVRRRLAQKLTFLLEDAADAAPPSEDEIVEYYAREAERYRRPGRTAFDHVFLSADRREDPARAAAALLDTVRTGDSDGWKQVGDPFMLARSYADRTDQEIAGLFGSDFAAAVSELPVGEWSGPVASTYGVHVVRVNGRTASRAPALAELRDRVVADLRQERRREQSQVAYEALRESYEVRLPATSPAGSTQP